MDRRFYVYIHRRATDNTIFYVGKGNGRRAWARSGRNRHWKFVEQKHGFKAEIVRSGMSEACAFTLEAIVVRNIGIENLANLCLGGGGATGWKHTDEAKKRIGEGGKGRPLHPNSLKALQARRGAKLSDEHKAKIGMANKGRTRTMPDEIRRKIAASHIGIRPSAETLAKMSASKMGQRKREQNNKFDRTIRVFRHDAHGEFVGPSYDLRVKYEIGASCMRGLITGQRHTARGWSYHGEKNG